MKPNETEWNRSLSNLAFFSDLARVSISSPGQGNEDSRSEIVSKLDIS